VGHPSERDTGSPPRDNLFKLFGIFFGRGIYIFLTGSRIVSSISTASTASFSRFYSLLPATILVRPFQRTGGNRRTTDRRGKGSSYIVLVMRKSVMCVFGLSGTRPVLHTLGGSSLRLGAYHTCQPVLAYNSTSVYARAVLAAAVTSTQRIEDVWSSKALRCDQSQIWSRDPRILAFVTHTYFN
jgi:hypothetical protein